MMTIDDALRVASQFQSEGKLAQAETLLKRILESNPAHAEALHLSGIIAYQTGKISLGVQLIQKAIESKPAVALFHSNLGEMHRQLKAIHLSIQCGQHAVELDPDLAIAWSNLGIAYYDDQQYSHAEECHQRALVINPALGCSLNNMGSIYKEYGKTKEATAFYQAAITASPHFVDPTNNLGVLFLQQEEFSLALECFQRAIRLAPAFAEAYCNLGYALLGLAQYNQARVHFEKTLMLKPDYAEAYCGIAKVYLHYHDFTESELAIRKAIAINPEQAGFYQHLAMIYNEQGNHEHALSCLNQALSMDSTLASLHFSKGTVLMEMGEVSQAEEQFLISTQDPKIETRLFAHYSLVQLRKIKSDHPSLQELLSIERSMHDLPRGKLEYVYFALGKCFDDLGEWSKAFACFKQGCTIKRKKISYTIEEQIQFTQQLIHSFTQETIDYLRAFANPSALPLFIVGMPRSGSTLVEQILSRHAGVYGAGELKYLTDLIQWPVQSNHSIVRYPENIAKLQPPVYHSIIEQYLSSLRRIAPDASRITDKMLNNFIAIGLIHALLPNAKIIHVQRNPIDTCLSCYTKLFTQGQLYSYDLAELGQYYRCYELIMNHWRQILPSDGWLDVEYEQIVGNLEAEARRLLAFCDLSWDPACLAFYESKRQVRTASFMQVRQPVYTSSVERWRRFEQELAPLISTLGVQP